LPARSRPRNRRESIEKKETRRDVGGKKERIQMFDVRIQGIGGRKWLEWLKLLNGKGRRSGGVRQQKAHLR